MGWDRREWSVNGTYGIISICSVIVGVGGGIVSSFSVRFGFLLLFVVFFWLFTFVTVFVFCIIGSGEVIISFVVSFVFAVIIKVRFSIFFK